MNKLLEILKALKSKKIDFVGLAKSLGVKFFLGLSGFQGWIANVFLNVIFKKIKELIKRFEIENQVKHEIENQKENYEKVINNPNSTADDVRRAGSDILNS